MSDYLDDELPVDGRMRMERHLGECHECRRLLAGLRRTLAALHRLPAPSKALDPSQLAAVVRAQLDHPQP